ncbi:MAG: metal ABC transporter ATP-binding protein [Candidatus Babeliales bacterium]
MMRPVLEVAHLSVTFGNQVALQDINFSVREHEVLAILGPNGAGKSTLLRAILNLIPASGKIYIDPQQKIAYLPPQETILKKNLPPLTVQDFFSFKSKNTKQVQALLEDFGLPVSILIAPFAALSTGQFQRMMLAWTIIDNPSFIFLDEPLSGIDIGGEETIYALLHRLWKERNLTIIMVTHNVSIIWKHATQVLCLNKHVIHSGPPDTTLTPEILKKVYNMDVAFYEHHHSS